MNRSTDPWLERGVVFATHLLDAHDVAKRARAHFGDASQDRKAIEECGELISAICQRDQGRIEQTSVDEEAADVLLVALGMLNPEAMGVLKRKTERLKTILAERGAK